MFSRRAPDLLDAGVPRHDPVGARVDRRHRHRHRRALVLALAAPGERLHLGPEHLVEPRGVATVAVAEAERCRQRDHLTHDGRSLAGELAGEHAAEAPPDDADPLAGALVELLETPEHPAHHPLVGAVVRSEQPPVGVVPAQSQQSSQRRRRAVRPDEPGQDQHRMTVAGLEVGEQRRRRVERAQLVQRQPLERRSSH